MSPVGGRLGRFGVWFAGGMGRELEEACVVVVGAIVVGDNSAVLVSSLRSEGDRSEYMAAVTAAPAPAPAAANSAILVLDMLASGGGGKRIPLYYRPI